ncbi:hypothetical protein HHK36_018588 [Tetracentron sinense]|uniref:Fe2OG dioxygenase domain-containing protein n=1 Tax=Tetracentron sinense TaxID=13715 RepID=A0A834Z4N1_TETSI|nr:hypothetical protein HHK36_018588 [Tetracentron sinense]
MGKAISMDSTLSSPKSQKMGWAQSSYPPHFRQPNYPNPRVDQDDSLQPITDSDPLPLIDLQQLIPEKLGEACRDWGLFRLVNHGIPLTLLNQLQDQANKLFSLPFESKQALFTNPMSYFWGTPALTPSGTAVAESAQSINWVEGFNVPLTQLPQLQGEDPISDSFRCVLEEYGRHMSRLARSVFAALAMNLGLDPTLSESYLSESTGIIRVYRYPYCSEASRTCGMEAHTDSSVLAVLNQDNVGGLQVFKDDEWFDIKPVADTLIVNLGDMMQAMSNDELKSVKHRVKVNRFEERVSICYFVFPMEDGVIRSSKYKPFTYKEFRAQVQEDIKASGFKVGLERFKLSNSSISIGWGIHIQAPAASFTGGLVGNSSPFVVLPQVTPLITFMMVLLAMFPCLVKAWREPRPGMITRWVAYAYTCGFFFGWHVHEKASLHFLIPLAIVAVHNLEDARHYFLLSIVSCYSLLHLLFEAKEYPIKVLLVTWLGFSAPFSKIASVQAAEKRENAVLHLILFNSV